MMPFLLQAAAASSYVVTLPSTCPLGARAVAGEESVADAENWLGEQARIHFPDSEFAKSAPLPSA
jgi:hypothetical protein